MAATRPGPSLTASGPATLRASSGTISGPGATARPIFSADHPHAVSIHSTRDSSIAAKATLNSTMATTAAP
jgi:hypothetical protein